MYKINDSLNERQIKKERSDFNFIIIAAFLLLIMSVVIFLNKYVYFNVIVDGSSMVPTLQSEDVLVVNRKSDVERGSIIVIEGEKFDGGGSVWLIKRAIAFGGDTVHIDNGKVYVNGSAIDEPYLPDTTFTKPNDWQEYTLKEDEIFYLGDNRNFSSDSRYAPYGPCNQSQVVGVVEEWSLSWRWLSGFFYDLGKTLRGAN